MLRYLPLICLLAVSLSGRDATAQCCSSGNPFVSHFGRPALKPGVLLASVTYRYSHAGTFYAKDHREKNLGFEQTAMTRYSELGLTFGLTKWMTLGTELGYFFNKTLHTAGSNPMTGRGFGDIAVNLQFNLFNHPGSRLTIQPSCGIKLPVGVFDQERDHVKLPITVQPSSGSYKYMASLFLRKGFSRKTALAFLVAGEYARRIESANFYYQYGPSLNSSVSLNRKLTTNLYLDLQVRHEFRGRSTREANETVESSGYQVVFLTPQLVWSFLPDWHLSASGDMPLYKYYNGVQMSFGYALSVRLTRQLDFSGLFGGKNRKTGTDEYR